MRSRSSAALPAALLLLVGSCDLPTSAPAWEGTWEISAHSATLHPEDFLPEGITVAEGGTVFEMRQLGGRAELALEEFCVDCRDLDGEVAAKPAFSALHNFGVDFPQRVRQASVVGGTASVTIRNHLPFDPIRPGNDTVGALDVAIVEAHGSFDTVAALRLDGSEAALPPGRIVTEPMELQEGVIHPSLRALLELDSPEGDSVLVERRDGLTVEVGIQELQMDRVGLRPGRDRYRMAPFAVATTDLDEDLRRRVARGRLRLEVSNPFETSLNLSIRVRPPHGEGNAEVAETFQLEPGETGGVVQLPGSPLRSMLEADAIVVEGDVSVPSQNDDLVVTPDRSLGIEAILVVEVGFGEGR